MYLGILGCIGVYLGILGGGEGMQISLGFEYYDLGIYVYLTR